MNDDNVSSDAQSVGAEWAGGKINEEKQTNNVHVAKLSDEISRIGDDLV